MRTSLERKVLASLKRNGIAQGSRIVLGVSGGADSIAMLDSMVRSGRFSVVVAHLNHCLRGEESDADEEFVRVLAAKAKLSFESGRANVARTAAESRRNIEAVARETRYEFLAQVARRRGAAFVATAHTRDDQVETILLRLIRGTSPRGLRGIFEQRPLGEGVTVIRPMLDATRDEVLEHCARYELDFRNDSSNFSLKLSRNRVRHELLPQLCALNPQFEDALLRMASLIDEDTAYLDEMVRHLANKAIVDAHSGCKIDCRPGWSDPQTNRSHLD